MLLVALSYCLVAAKEFAVPLLCPLKWTHGQRLLRSDNIQLASVMGTCLDTFKL